MTPVLLQPHFQLMERRGAQRINAALCVHANVNQSGIAEHAEMLGDLRLPETQPADQVPDGPWTVTQEFDYMETARLGEGPECGHHGESEYARGHIFLSRHIRVREYTYGISQSCHAEEMSLRETWREVRGDEKSGFNFLHELAVGFGLVAHALPFRIVAEGLPVGSGGIAARMREEVDERLAFERFVGRRPVGNILNSMLLEELHGVFAKPAQQVVKLALVDVIDA
jgi:hypothetical protein